MKISKKQESLNNLDKKNLFSSKILSSFNPSHPNSDGFALTPSPQKSRPIIRIGKTVLFRPKGRNAHSPRRFPATLTPGII
jgi:hypothetical protein